MKHRHKPRFKREEITDASGLLSALRQIFSDTSGFPAADLIDEIAAGDANHHKILGAFRSAFPEEQASTEQIETLAKLIELSLGEPDELENAWMTCFFERRQRSGPLWSRLSPSAKRYVKAH